MKKTVDEYCGQPSGTFDKFVKDNSDPDQFAWNAKRYPNIVKLGIPITKDGNVKFKDLRNGLKRHKLSAKIFDNYFGVQTASGEGPYADDVEAVLNRMINKKLTGTQLFWD